MCTFNREKELPVAKHSDKQTDYIIPSTYRNILFADLGLVSSWFLTAPVMSHDQIYPVTDGI